MDIKTGVMVKVKNPTLGHENHGSLYVFSVGEREIERADGSKYRWVSCGGVHTDPHTHKTTVRQISYADNRLEALGDAIDVQKLRTQIMFYVDNKDIDRILEHAIPIMREKRTYRIKAEDCILGVDKDIDFWKVVNYYGSPYFT